MNTHTLELLQKLSAADAPSGAETPAASLCAYLLRPLTDEVRFDALGNVIAEKRCGKRGAKRVLLDAHIDEVGFIVTGRDGDFLRFDKVGGIDQRLLPASTVKILTEPPVYGVIDVLPPHVLKAGDSDKSQKIDELRIDAGGADVDIGTPVVFASESYQPGDKLFVGKAMDDRACFASIILALEKLADVTLDCDVIVAGAVQEEVGTRGAYAAAYAADADFALVCDVGFAEQPDVTKPEVTAKTGGGAIISYCANADRALTKRIIAAANEKNIALQVFAEGGGDSGTDARAVQISRRGVKTAILGVPLRYMHTPSETVDARDVETLAELIAEVLKGGVFNV
ncbi:MAG: M20/M25/M40 family metallo-hydrolase [Oscillospiraceae bacterium]|nr:M20/M25/M40 family metallo-hydrolase [Oscillospiraceae bacterium]